MQMKGDSNKVKAPSHVKAKDTTKLHISKKTGLQLNKKGQKPKV